MRETKIRLQQSFDRATELARELEAERPLLVKEAKEAASLSGADKGLGKLFTDPNMISKIANNPKTAKYLADPAFMNLVSASISSRLVLAETNLGGMSYWWRCMLAFLASPLHRGVRHRLAYIHAQFVH